jgi:beta-galactosidase
VANLMGTAQEQVSFSKATLATRGITGDVILHRRPQGMHISDVFVKTSVRRSSIEPEIEVSGIVAVPSLQIINRVFDEKGKVVKTFSQKATLSSTAALQVFNTDSYWQNPKFWDLDQPQMYQLHTLIISNGKLIDEYVQEFGFREFWIEGKNFYLNGTRINLRPTLDPPGDGMGELIAASIDGIRNAGFNFAELWPTNFDQRGEIRDWREVMAAADKKGFLLSGVALPFSFYIVDHTFAHTWEKPGVKETWEQRMVYELRKQRNHPSVIMWGSSANFFGHAQDQNPLHIGQSGWIKNDDFWQRNATAAQDAIQTIKKHDPTRPVFTHHGAYVGDVHTLNFYLSLTPLQEREEWLSHYSRFGKMPFMAIEFGTPLHCTFLRGRNGFGNNIRTEPLVTEFVAMYGGSAAYKQETDEYRSLIRKNFLGGQQYQPWSNPVEMERLPAFQQLQHLFSKNTWRSYRTWGISGGMVPWHRGHGWVPDTTVKGTAQMPAFKGGRKGFYFPEVDKKKLKYLQPGGWVTMPAGQAIMENNNDVLAYIAGGEHNFAAKDHHFQEGSRVSKQLLFFNDTRVPQTCQWEARAQLGGKVLERQSGTMLLPVGEKGSKSFWFQLPAGQKQWKQDGNILLTATINGKTLRDTFSFRSFRKSTEATNKEVVVFDPEGKTSFMLQSLGFTVRPWQGDTTVPFVVMGRNAMLQQYQHPASLEAYVRKGGKLLLMNQHPDSVAHKKGFRTSQFISRNVFLVDSLHPLVAGLDDSDFRNWNGESRLTEAYPDYVNAPVKKGSSEIPYYGWHWGNQGGVATGALEKPHRSGWRPLLQCEFDMAYSPLMELPYGKGQVVWSNLDLEDHFAQDVVAATMAGRLIRYMDTLRPLPRTTEIILLGTPKDAALLDDLGLVYRKNDKITEKTGLLLVGDIDALQQEAVTAFARKGGNVLVLPRTAPGQFLGAQFETNTAFNGGYHIPRWTEAAGLSVSDTRYRTGCSSIVVKGGVDETGANGLLGKKSVGKALSCLHNFDPNRFHADSVTYFRYTRWRQTRALAQVLSNLGATFLMDKAIFEQAEPTYSVLLDGMWKAVVTKPVPAAKEATLKHKDLGFPKKHCLT